MAPLDRRTEKEKVALELLERGSLFVYLDPRREGVRVPAWLGRQAQLVLQFGLNMPVPIPDLTVDAEGVSGTLSFSRQPFGCRLPWAAIFALVGDDGAGMVFEEDLPEEVAAEVEAGFREDRKKAGPRLSAIDGGRATPREAAKEPAEEAKEPAEAPMPAPTPLRAPSRPPRPSLSRRSSGAAEARSDDPPPSEPPEPPEPAPKPRGGHLRLVK